MNLIKTIILIISIGVVANSSVRAETKELIFAHVGALDSIYDMSVNEYARRVNEKLASGYKVVAAGNSRFGGDAAMPEKLKTGEVAFGLLGTTLTSISPKFGIFELPFLIRDREQVRKISDALLEPVLQPEAQKSGFRILAIWEVGFRQITNNVRAIKRPEDLKGLKIRIPHSPWREKLFRTLGAEPVQMEYGKLHEALRIHEVEGQENPLGQITAGKLHEVQHFLSLCDYLYSPLYLIVSEEHFVRLPPAVQDALAKTANEMRSWIFQSAIRMESDLMDQIGDKMQVDYIDLEAFRRASRPIYGEFARSVRGGLKLIETVSTLTDVSTDIVDGQ